MYCPKKNKHKKIATLLNFDLIIATGVRPEDCEQCYNLQAIRQIKLTIACSFLFKIDFSASQFMSGP